MTASVAVVGAGPGGLATAVDLAERGHRVTVVSRSPARVEPWRSRGGVEVVADGETRLVPLRFATTDLAGAMAETSLIFVAVPAYGQETAIRPLLPFLRDDMTILLMPGCCGSLEIAPLLAEAGLSLSSGILLGEAITLPRFGVSTPDGPLRILPPAPRSRVAAFPAERTSELMPRLDGYVNAVATPNVLDPGLNNPNFLFHPGPLLLNYASIERQAGQLDIMTEAMTPGVLRCLDALDLEKGALMRTLGLEPIALDDLYRDETGHSPDLYRRAAGPRPLARQIPRRFIDEDVTYGAVTYASLGQQLAVPMPLTDATITLLSAATGRDLATDGRTVRRLGLEGLTASEISAYLRTGVRR